MITETDKNRFFQDKPLAEYCPLKFPNNLSIKKLEPACPKCRSSVLRNYSRGTVLNPIPSVFVVNCGAFCGECRHFFKSEVRFRAVNNKIFLESIDSNGSWKSSVVFEREKKKTAFERLGIILKKILLPFH